MTPASRAAASAAAEDPDPHDDEALLDRARALAAASQAGRLQHVLRGKKLGLLCEDPNDAAATLFVSAATELGAHVACVRVDLTDRSPLAVVRETAGLLARLYDAVECLDMSPLLVELLRKSAGIPFFLGASTQTHRTAALAARMAGRPDRLPDARRRVLQAVLTQALACP